MSTKIIIGDVRERIEEQPSESVHCIVTSPPYFGLRDYGMAAQIGLEPTPDAYVAEMVSLFREIRRVLRSDGTFWLNLGDSYATDAKGIGGGVETSNLAGGGGRQATASPGGMPKPKYREFGLKKKDRFLIPARVALTLQADGWYLRDEIIWHKPNPMPVSVTDRTTPAHEMLYMFAKSARYHYDMKAIKEPRADLRRSDGHKGQSERNRGGRTDGFTKPRGIDMSSDVRQPRSVWTIATRPFKGAHFATFPPDLIRPCILAGCPAGGTVLDPFFGAGTTGLVAQELGRDCIGFELNPEYAQIARERLGLRIPIPLDQVRAELALLPALEALRRRLCA